MDERGYNVECQRIILSFFVYYPNYLRECTTVFVLIYQLPLTCRIMHAFCYYEKYPSNVCLQVTICCIALLPVQVKSELVFWIGLLFYVPNYIFRKFSSQELFIVLNIRNEIITKLILFKLQKSLSFLGFEITSSYGVSAEILNFYEII